MKISKDSIDQIDFEGLQIIDYTSGREITSSLAEITVPSGIRHKKAYSNRSDKYYYIVSGHIQFNVEEELYDLSPGDVCVILKGRKFSYKNGSREPAKLILVHTPSFNLEFEVFEE
ncbi:MAG: cupin domain-containing protein [Thermodesulfobacteriota bacterium]|jgi:mannose-6-phosphate isomerase-like protein (cupin superfamily)